MTCIGYFLNILPTPNTSGNETGDLVNTLVNYTLMFLIVFLIYVSAYQSGKHIRQKDIRMKNRLNHVFHELKIEDIET